MYQSASHVCCTDPAAKACGRTQKLAKGLYRRISLAKHWHGSVRLQVHYFIREFAERLPGNKFWVKKGKTNVSGKRCTLILSLLVEDMYCGYGWWRNCWRFGSRDFFPAPSLWTVTREAPWCQTAVLQDSLRWWLLKPRWKRQGFYRVSEDWLP